MFFYSGLLKAVKNFKPDVIITTGFSMATVKIWWYCKRRAIPYIIWSGTVPSKGNSHFFARKFLRRSLAKSAKGFVAYGTLAKNYLLHLSVEENKISIAINTTDVEFFRLEVDKIRKSTKSTAEPKRLLYVGHLTKGKRIDSLLTVASQLLKTRNDFVLDIVGDGPERRHLEAFSRSLGLNGHVRFQGFKQRDGVLEFLAHSNCFLFPSEYDIWGLVLVEAMAAGIPCLASVHAGASSDMVKDGENGFLVDFENTGSVVEKVNCLLDNPYQAGSFGENAQRFVLENANLKVSASGFLRALSICKAR
jgi:glycosyltransferase involved in cell wall biosynthesis